MTTSAAQNPAGSSQRDWAADVILAATVTVGVALPYFILFPNSVNPAFILLSAAMTAPLALRRRAPLLMLGMVTLAGLVQLALVAAPTLSLIVWPVVAYSVARWVPGAASRSVLVVGAFGSVLAPLRWVEPYTTSPNADILAWAACLGAFLTPYAMGRRSLDVAESRAEQVRAAEERYQLLLAEREQQTRLAEASARTMIARELHDIVAHSLSVIIVQAEGGRAVATKKPEAAAEALDTIADTGREALHEMRRIVGVLRAGPDAEEKPTYTPAPRFDDIPELVSRTSDRAQLVITGTPQPVSQALALTVYRIVQEALTNFLKHAGPDAHAVVTLTHAQQTITVDVVDDGEGVDDPTGGGNGLRGMHERVSSMGGVLQAGPETDRPGFRVHAVLPIRENTATRRS